MGGAHSGKLLRPRGLGSGHFWGGAGTSSTRGGKKCFSIGPSRRLWDGPLTLQKQTKAVAPKVGGGVRGNPCPKPMQDVYKRGSVSGPSTGHKFCCCIRRRKPPAVGAFCPPRLDARSLGGVFPGKRIQRAAKERLIPTPAGRPRFRAGRGGACCPFHAGRKAGGVGKDC